jgi:DNA-binding XRE family transcriptional regulator
LDKISFIIKIANEFRSYNYERRLSMFRNLEAEMVRKGVSKKEMAALIGVSYNTIRNKINGKQKFLYDEAFKIREHFFPELSLEYLFD